MTRKLRPAVALFALGMMGLGALGIATGDFADEWQPLIAWSAGRTALGYAAAAVMLACGAALLAERSAKWSARILLPWLAVWQVLRLVPLVRQPGTEGNWEVAGEVAVMLAGGLVLLAGIDSMGERVRLGWLSGKRAVRLAQVWFGVWLIPIGLSHFFYAAITYSMVPAWMPWRGAWGPIVGVAHIVAGIAVLCGARIGVLSRVAARCWAGMIFLFVLLVWTPAVAAHPRAAGNWSELITSWAMAAGAAVVAQGFGEAQAMASSEQKSRQ
ncbi:MAG TPA: hypothetical protein VMD29_07165 [Terracidiphilus sp.]|nr:hypothetical protein [Terracidiphilus sp.]